MLAISFVLLGVACASTSVSAIEKRESQLASSFAGAPTSAVWPPPGAIDTAIDTLFPDASEVGYPGPTPTGDEAEAIATAPVLPMDSVYPLVDPSSNSTASFNGSSTSSPVDVIRQWGNLSPWYSVPADAFGLPPTASPKIPDGCTINQVHLLHRHGARYPTSGSAPAQFAELVNEAANNGSGFGASGELEFLNTWTYKLGAEILTPFGREQLFDLGVGFRVKYGELLKNFTELPVWRTTSEERMVDSALHFAAGFFGVQSYTTSYHQLIMIESDGFNNTLAPYDVCYDSNTNIGSYGSTESGKWVNIYLRGAVERLQPLLEGFEVTPELAFSMQQLCAYETVALGYSAFCDLFTDEEWVGYEYANDLSFWYSNGPGNPTSAAIGGGWVQELLARLTQMPIDGPTFEVNTTLDDNNVTFPLYQPIFVDATHDTIISAIVTTMNFTSLAAEGPLPTDHIPDNHTYIVSHIAPFGSNLVGQVLSCPSLPTTTNASLNPLGTHIRFILNDGVLPLTGLSGCEYNADGLCELGVFVEGMRERIGEIEYEWDCFGNYTVPVPDEIVDGTAPAPA